MITIGDNGSVTVSPGVDVNVGNTAGQTIYQGGENQVAYNAYQGAPVQFSGTYGEPAYISGGGGSYASAGTINGQQYTQDAYAEARQNLAQQQARLNEEARKRRESGSGDRLNGRPVTTSQAAKIAGLGITSDTKAEQQEQLDKAKEAEKRQKKTPIGVPSVSVEEVADMSESLESQPQTSSENLGFVDTETGEVVSTTPSRTNVDSKVKVPKGRPGRPAGVKRGMPSSKMAKKMAEIDKQVADSSRTRYLSPSYIESSIDALSANDVDNMHDKLELNKALLNWRDPTPLELAWSKAHKNYGNKLVNQRINDRYLSDERDGIISENEVKFTPYQNSEEWEIDQDLGDAETNEERIDRLVNLQVRRSREAFDEVTESPKSMKGRGFDEDVTHHPWMDDEAKIQRKFAEVRDMIRLRLLNPALLRIQSEHVETTVEGRGENKTTKGRIRYSVEVENAIQNIRNLYGCSIRDVLTLVQLRAGLGVDMNGKIGGKNPKEFKLSDAQFIELAHDIERSQRKYGHPMAIVNGVPGGNKVRDDSGKFVVVAGTRCYPLGYVPENLLKNLSRNKGSALMGQSVGEIQRRIGNEWLNTTYRELMANAKGNALWQMRAIENMMRAVMSMDGIDPSNLDIPEIKINRTLMQMAAEKSIAGDESIKLANEERERREKRRCEQFRSIYLKTNGGRNSDGSINSPSRKRWASAEDMLRGISRFEQICKTADIFLIITSPLEAMQSIGEQHVGEWILGKILEQQVEGTSLNLDDYRITDRLASASVSDDAVEARSVAESLYRIGGWAAIDAFLGDMDEKHYRYRLTNADLRKFMTDYGVTGGGHPDALMKKLGIDPRNKPAFLANAQGVMNYVEGFMLGSGSLFQTKEAGQFTKMAMMEMARARNRGDESYTNSEVEQWADISGEEMMRNLLRTEAGREAFMTQGITSIGRKSPWDFALRQVMARNGLTEFLVRTCFDRFPEYGMNKIMKQIPLSNTLSYLGSYAVDGIGKMMSLAGGEASITGGSFVGNAGEALQRVGEYQAGRRNGFVEGLFKNLLYDTVMAVNKLLVACLYYGVLKLMGGLKRPPRDDDEYTWSEWIIGDYEGGLPIKWAWFMDDLSGVGLPLGAAFAIADEGGWTPEARDRATKTFMNAVANFNDGTALFDAIELFNNFDAEMAEAMGNGDTGKWLNPTIDERRQTSVELMAWKFLGDTTPTIVKQLLPWSRDFLFRDDYFARSASKVYDTDKYSMNEAQKDYRVKTVDDYKEYMMRREAQNNPVAAAVMDLIWNAGGDSDKTGFKFTEQPILTETDALAQLMWNRYSLDKSKLSRNPEEAKTQSREWAEYICQEIDSNFKDPTDALSKGFIMNPEARMACQEYCNWMMYDHIPEMKQNALNEMREIMGMRYLPEDTYNNLVQTYESQIEHYRMLYENYFSGSSEIPWRLPRYGILDSDYETRYVGKGGGAAVNPIVANVSNMLFGTEYEPGEKEKYSYGNIPNSLPFYSPQRTDLFAQQSRPYWLREGDDGNLLADTQGIYDMLGNMQPPPNMSPEEAEAWKQKALDTRDQLFGDQGRDATPTSGKRGLESIETTMPEGFKTYYDPEQVSKALGFDAFDKSKEKEEAKSNEASSGGGYSSYGSRRYGGGGGGYRSYSYGGYAYGGGGGYSSSYNPRIYSNPRQVNSDRAAGLQTRQPYKATNTYLRPNFYTKGSREAYKRSDI